MGQHRLHSKLAARAFWLGLIAVCAGGGCWQEIHYTGPDPSTVARRRPPSDVDPEPSGPSEVADSTASGSAQEHPSPPAESEPPVADTDVASTSREELEVAEIAEDAGADEMPSDDLAPEQTPLAEVETPTTPQPEQPAQPDPTLATRRAAWQLGSKLTLAAIAHDRGLVPKDSAKWFAEARAAAQLLGTSIAELPEPAAANEGDSGSRRVHDYLFQQGQRVWRELTDRHGDDHAALFEAAVKSNVLLVLYQPGSPSVEPLAASIRDTAPKAELPLELLQPLLDTLANQSPAAEVRVAVRKLHADVERYLAEQAEQE
jgi:hypothetical protein